MELLLNITELYEWTYARASVCVFGNVSILSFLWAPEFKYLIYKNGNGNYLFILLYQTIKNINGSILKQKIMRQ